MRLKIIVAAVLAILVTLMFISVPNPISLVRYEHRGRRWHAHSFSMYNGCFVYSIITLGKGREFAWRDEGKAESAGLRFWTDVYSPKPRRVRLFERPYETFSYRPDFVYRRTVTLPIFWPAALCALYLVVSGARAAWRRIRRPKPGHCAGCGYDLTGLSDVPCPECGKVPTAAIGGHDHVSVAE